MDWWRAPLTELIGGRRVILTGGLAAQWTPIVGQVRELGATDVLVVATGGTGAGPQPDARRAVVDATVGIDDEMARIRATIDAVAHPPPAIVDAVESFDPHREAVVLGAFLGTVPSLCGRPMLAHRRPSWVALEDKLRADALFDTAGVARAPSIVAPINDAAARRHEVDAGDGTVWAVDATQGFHGGGTGTRWVVDDEDAARVTSELGRRGTHVRVMPFLDGVAASIHGIVLPDGVATVRPVELVTLRRGRDLIYAGCSTFWDPPVDVRAEMVEAARRVGELLRRDVDFRGAFTIDGVVTADGWRPTELNPRYGAGLNVIARGLERLPLLLVLDLVVAGRDIGIGAADLEAELVAAADTHRGGGTWMLEAAPNTTIDERPARFDGERWSWTDDADRADGIVVAGGHFARCTYAPATTPSGPSTGQRAVAFWRFLDAEGITSVGPLSAPTDVAA